MHTEATTTNAIESRQPSRARPSRALTWAIGLATVMTFGFAAVSAWAVHSEPTMRAEDSSYQSQSKALAVRRSLSASRTTVAYADAGATHSDEYRTRVHSLDRSL